MFVISFLYPEIPYQHNVNDGKTSGVVLVVICDEDKGSSRESNRGEFDLSTFGLPDHIHKLRHQEA